VLFIVALEAFAVETVTISDLGIVADAPVYVAIEKGYFKERTSAAPSTRCWSKGRSRAGSSREWAWRSSRKWSGTARALPTPH